PPPGAGVWGGLPGCAVREDAARGASGKPRRVRRYRDWIGWAERRAGVVDEQQRRRQVLVGSVDGAEEPRGQGNPDRLRGRIERVSASHRERISAGGGAALHCAPGAGESEDRKSVV